MSPQRKTAILIILVVLITAFVLQRLAREDKPALTDTIQTLQLSQTRLWDPHSSELEDWQYFHRPSSIEPGPFGDLFVADAGNSRIVRFWENGEHEIIGRSGEGPGELQMPMDLYIDSENRLLWIADPRLQRISLFAIYESGTDFVTSFTLPNYHSEAYPNIVPSLIDTSFYFGTSRTDLRFLHVSKDGEPLVEFGELPISPVPSIRLPNGGLLFATASQHLIFVGQYIPIIEKYQLDGQMVTSIPFMEKEYLEKLAEVRKEFPSSSNLIIRSIQEAYVPYKSNNIYLMFKTDLFFVLDSTSLQVKTEINVNYTNEEHAIIPFCVVESKEDHNLISMYAIELRTGGIYKFTP